jgi:hypothetical protein
MNISLVKNMAKSVLLTIFITSCASGAGGAVAKGAPGSAEWFGSASQSTIDAHYKDVCKRYNFPSRSLLNNCIQDEIATAKQSAGIEK